MGRTIVIDPYSSEFDWEAERDREFGEWLSARRKKMVYSVERAASASGISTVRLTELENGEATKGITKHEALELAKIYNVDPRAMMIRAIDGF